MLQSRPDDRSSAGRVGYQPHIDGLRAIAVLSVILYHFGMPGIPAGFLGVDVFFVISGFLIVRLIRDETLATGRFRYGHFFMRRVRRLFPALAVTLLVSALVGFVLLSPEHFRQFGASMLAATLSVSNFYFKEQTDYFELAAEFRPLLHTWSLGVEEQFYLVIPLFVVLAVRAKGNWLLILTTVLTLVSLILADTQNGRMSAFYLMPFRIFEFGIGALLLFVVERKPRDGRLLELLLLTGLLLIIASICLLTSESHLPGFLTLPVALGTALMLYAGEAPVTGILLRNPLSVWIGKISYSLYLVHWPVFVYGNYASTEPLTALSRALLLVVSFALAALLYRFVEQPFRYPRSVANGGNGTFMRGAAACAAFCAAFGSAIYLSQGMPFRLSPEELRLLASAKRQTVIEGPCHYVNEGLDTRLQSQLDTCFAKDGRAIIVIGDSHGRDLFNALAVNTKRPHVVGIMQSGCRPVTTRKHCFYPRLGEFLERNSAKIEAIVFTQKGSYFLTDRNTLPVDRQVIDATAAYLDGIALHHIPILWVGPQWEPRFDIQQFPALLPQLRRTDYNRSSLPFIADVDRAIPEVLRDRKSPVTYVSKLEAIGPLEASDFLVDGEFTYLDGDHWSAKGEEVFGRELVDRSPILNQLFQ